EKLEFEKAAVLLSTLRSIEKSVEKQKVDRPKGKDIDVIGLHRVGERAAVSQLIFNAGRLADVRYYSFKDCLQEDAELLTSFLLQHYLDSPSLPKEILLPFTLEKCVEEILAEKRKVKLLTPSRGEKKKLLVMAEENAKAAFLQE